jgi:peptide deformylase
MISVEYLDYNGKPSRLEADNLLSICIQHEIDHRDGITIFESYKTSDEENILFLLR